MTDHTATIAALRELRADRPKLRPHWLKAIDEAVEGLEAEQHTEEKWRLACSIAMEKVVENWQHDVSPKTAGNRMDKIVMSLLTRASAAEARLATAVEEEAGKVIEFYADIAGYQLRPLAVTGPPIHIASLINEDQGQRARAWRDKYGKQGQ